MIVSECMPARYRGDAGQPRSAQLRIDPSERQQVQSALNLFLPLKTPAQMPALLAMLDDETTKAKIQGALASLNYVHFARFMPSPDGSILWVITTFDGEAEPYIMDFVGVLSDEFTQILLYVQDAPRLPVNRYPRDFVEFVLEHNLAQVKVWSAYRDATVIDIQRQVRP